MVSQGCFQSCATNMTTHTPIHLIYAKPAPAVGLRHAAYINVSIDLQGMQGIHGLFYTT